MSKKSSTRNSQQSEKSKYSSLFEALSSNEYLWVVPLAQKVRVNSKVLAKFMGHVVSQIAKEPLIQNNFTMGRLSVLKSLTKILVPEINEKIDDIEEIFEGLKENFTEYSKEVLTDPTLVQHVLGPLIEFVCENIEKNPKIIVLLGHPELLKETFGDLGEKFASFLSIIPAISNHAAEKFPELKETFFCALFNLEKDERESIYKLAEEVLAHVYKEKVFPMLKETLSTDPRGKVLAPILLGAIAAIPGESCINTVLSIACTPQSEFSNGRVIAIAIQEMGGLYVKISQVLSELCPPSLAKELRTSQDDAGGIFPSIEKSFYYMLKVFDREELQEWKNYFKFPQKPVRHFASASVGALYLLDLNDLGKEKFELEHLLIKIQRPNLRNLFAKQSTDILGLTDNAQQAIIDDTSLSPETATELLGIVTAIRKAVINYYKQGQEELDFTLEEKNANKVRNALKDSKEVKIPRFFHSSEQVVIMECVTGAKVTKIVQTKYLERKKIADKIARVYLELIFKRGVVWADPHPGNILYDDVIDQVSMIDLNPCFVWTEETILSFKNLIYRLFLRDSFGIYKTLYRLCENIETLHSNTLIDDIDNFLRQTAGPVSLTRFVGEFMKLLSENHVDLKIEVQAALRGLSQIALTTSLISTRNNFAELLRKEFSFKQILQTIWDVGIYRVLKTIINMVFEFTRNIPDYEIGPVLDERDISKLREKINQIVRGNVCNIDVRRVSPEDKPNLKLSGDGHYILITSTLSIEIIDRVKPAIVKYVVEIPTRKWLKNRQEFIKLSGLSKCFALIECLEQIRRSSLDDYWCLIESWDKSNEERNEKETYLHSKLKIAAYQLYFIRFKGIWNNKSYGALMSRKFAWSLLTRLELLREFLRQQYNMTQKNIFYERTFLVFIISPFFRLFYLIVELFVYLLLGYLNNQKFSMHLSPLTSDEVSNLVLYNLGRDFIKQ